MSITQDDVVRILDLLDQSTYEELDLQTGDFRLTVRKSGRVADSRPAQSDAAAAAGTPPARTPDPAAGARPTTEAPAGSGQAPAGHAPSAANPSAADTAGLVGIQSPLLGTFYRSPKPGAPAFVEVGSQVNAEDTVCLIEVMKTYTTVTAGVRGRVVRICAENTELVEYQQILFLVQPE